MSLSLLSSPLINIVLPPRCPLCGVTVEADNRFCPCCWRQLDFLEKPWCSACGIPLAYDSPDESRCVNCLIESPIHDGVRAAVRYDDQSSLIAMRLKYGTRLGLAKLIAEHLRKHIPASHEEAIIVPVPLHRSRLWRRGFNQSVLIGKALARATEIEMNYNVIYRREATPPLRGMTGRQRKKTVDGAFALCSGAPRVISGRAILLVDDVYTSGSTSNACARLLKKAGAKQVLVLCWARVISDYGNG